MITLEFQCFLLGFSLVWGNDINTNTNINEMKSFQKPFCSNEMEKKIAISVYAKSVANYAEMFQLHFVFLSFW